MGRANQTAKRLKIVHFHERQTDKLHEWRSGRRTETEQETYSAGLKDRKARLRVEGFSEQTCSHHPPWGHQKPLAEMPTFVGSKTLCYKLRYKEEDVQQNLGKTTAVEARDTGCPLASTEPVIFNHRGGDRCAPHVSIGGDSASRQHGLAPRPESPTPAATLQSPPGRNG